MIGLQSAAYAGGRPDERQAQRRPHRLTWRTGLTGLLLPLAAGDHRADPAALEHRPPATQRQPRRAPVADATASAIPRLPAAGRRVMPLAAGFDVRRVRERWRRQLVADQRVPGLAMAIVQNGRMLSARGYGITDVSDAAADRRAHRVPPRLAVEGVRRHHDRPAGQRRLAALGQPRHRLHARRCSSRDPGAAQQLTVADVLSHRVGLTHNTYDRDLEAQRRLPQRWCRSWPTRRWPARRASATATRTSPSA